MSLHLQSMSRIKLAFAVASAAIFMASPAMAQDVLKIGVIGPMTGGAAAWGMAAQTATEMVAEKANAEGGLLVGGKRYKVQVISYDDQYKATEGVSAYNRLRQDGVKYMHVLGTNSALALKENFEQDKVIAFNAGYSPKLIDANTHYLYRIYPTPIQYGGSMAKYLKTLFPANTAPKVVILNPNDETGFGLQEFQKTEYKAKGFDIVSAEAYERTVKDFQPLLTKVLAQKPDIIDLGITAPATAGVIMRQARELGYKNRIVKMGGVGMGEIVDVAGPQVSEGVIGIVQWDQSKPGFLPVAQEYQKRRGHFPNETMIAYYDAAAVMLAGIQASGVVGDADKFAQSFPKVFPYKTLQDSTMSLNGTKWYGTDKQMDTPFFLAQIKAGKPVVIATLRPE